MDRLHPLVCRVLREGGGVRRADESRRWYGTSDKSNVVVGLLGLGSGFYRGDMTGTIPTELALLTDLNFL